jgi:hypothetical protein
VGVQRDHLRAAGRARNDAIAFDVGTESSVDLDVDFTDFNLDEPDHDHDEQTAPHRRPLAHRPDTLLGRRL